MAINSYAKINLYLKIGKKVSSGYHNIQSVMQKIDLSDNISIEPISEDKIVVESTNKEIENESNLAYDAAMLLKKKYKVKHGVKIFIEKNIPLEAGLGGGSSNAATALINLNKLWGIKLKENDEVIGMEVASDEMTLLSVTENGYGKRTPIAEYRLINRGGSGVINIQCSERNGNVVSICSLTDNDDIILISKNGIVIRVPATDISVIGRNTQGVRIMKLEESDKVVATVKVPRENDN